MHLVENVIVWNFKSQMVGIDEKIIIRPVTYYHSARSHCAQTSSHVKGISPHCVLPAHLGQLRTGQWKGVVAKSSVVPQ